ncbi:MAG: radical SAM protein [Phycisphaerae bacterium]|nr:radical SAM protein [Phycisphaerae bacterium]
MHRSDESAKRLFARHDRNWRDNRYVYPVCSRRSGGISIGVNVNISRTCTFNCVYCQVDRRTPAPTGDVDLDALRAELAAMLAAFTTGRLLAEPEFAKLPEPLRRLNDVAFSGDGEPTGFAGFADAAAGVEAEIAVAGVDAKLVLITNATLFHLPRVQAGLDAMHRRSGEIWAKLDAGTEEMFRRIERTQVPLQRVLDNIAWAAGRYPIVIQSCFMRLRGQGPTTAEIDAWCDRLTAVADGGGRIKLVQVYTVARQPAEAFVSPLPAAEVDAIVARLAQRVPGLSVRPFYGPG